MVLELQTCAPLAQLIPAKVCRVHCLDSIKAQREVAEAFSCLGITLPGPDLHYQTRPSNKLCTTRKTKTGVDQSIDVKPRLRSEVWLNKSIELALLQTRPHAENAFGIRLEYAVKHRLSYTCPKNRQASKSCRYKGRQSFREIAVRSASFTPH